MNKKDFKNRELFNKLEQKKLCAKFILIHYLNKQENKVFNKKVLSKNLFHRVNKFSKTKIVRNCILNSRSRGSTRKVGGISRILLRDMLQAGIIPGYKKAVW